MKKLFSVLFIIIAIIFINMYSCAISNSKSDIIKKNYNSYK